MGKGRRESGLLCEKLDRGGEAKETRGDGPAKGWVRDVNRVRNVGIDTMWEGAVHDVGWDTGVVCGGSGGRRFVVSGRKRLLLAAKRSE